MSIFTQFRQPRAVAAAAWESAGMLPADFASPRAALLPDGHVLAVASTSSALYTSATNSWGATQPPPSDTTGGQLVVTADGRALLTGGVPSIMLTNPYSRTVQVLRFDPATASWTKLPDMKNGRDEHTMTVLPSGRVLVAGGSVGGLSPRAPALTQSAADLFDPATATWSAAAPLAQARSSHTATLLADGRVLVTGGAVAKTVNSENAGSDLLASAEIYNPATNTWQATAPMANPRAGHTATLLLDGTVLVMGGESGMGSVAERYDPAANSWTSGQPQAYKFVNHTATLLPNGDVLIAGGNGNNAAPISTTIRYLYSLKSFGSFTSLSSKRARQAAVLVNDQALLIGGSGASTSAERYDFAQPDARCFQETGRCVSGAFLAYWQAHGQLAINGYPLSQPFAEQLDGKAYVVQYFERLRMEAHPESPAPYDVLLGQFGRTIHPVDPAASQQAGATYFPETGHNVAGGFLAYWQTNGGLAQFGYPLSEVISETLEDGKSYQVQYFERARFEYHPENAAPFNVLLGQFGRQILAGR